MDRINIFTITCWSLPYLSEPAESKKTFKEGPVQDLLLWILPFTYFTSGTHSFHLIGTVAISSWNMEILYILLYLVHQLKPWIINYFRLIVRRTKKGTLKEHCFAYSSVINFFISNSWKLGLSVKLWLKIWNTSLSAMGALTYHLQHLTACNAVPPETPHCLQHPKWPPGGPNRLTGSGKGS